MKILAFDPGGTTGWAQFEIEYIDGVPQWQLPLFKHFTCGQIGDNAEHHLLLWKLLMREHPDIVIGERFDNRGNEFARLMSKEYLGILKLWCELFEQEFVSQGASDAKGWVGNDKLDTLGLLAQPRTKWVHANDALRHMLFFLAVSGIKKHYELSRPFLAALKTEP